MTISDDTLMAYADGELDAATRASVEAAMQARPVMSWINLGEVAYIVERLAGELRCDSPLRPRARARQRPRRWPFREVHRPRVRSALDVGSGRRHGLESRCWRSGPV